MRLAQTTPASYHLSSPRARHLIVMSFAMAVLAGCATDLVANEGFEIDCDGEPCDWVVVEGDARFTGSWHDRDPGADRSAPGRIVVEQWTAPFSLEQRELVLDAAIARDSGVDLEIELDWYVAGANPGATYWDRGPTLIDSRRFAVDDVGVFRLATLVSTPSLEASGCRP